MIDYGDAETERVLRNMERKIGKIYSRAAEEAKQKLQAYWNRIEKKDLEQQQKLKNGEITQAEYIDWRKRKIATGSRYSELTQALTEDYVNADKIAASVVGDHLPDVYAINRNFAMFEIERGKNMDLSFTLYNRATVEKLIKEKPSLLPKPRVNIPKDQRWNHVHIRGEITQGILQGEGIPKIAKRLEKVAGMDKAAAVRNARTAVTTAQNTARLDTYKEAQKKGIGLQKQWIATLDNRTRDSHVDLDGEIVDVDKTFSNGMDCPGGSGPPEEVYNCRCRMVAHLTGFDNLKDPERINKLGNVSYEDWKKMARERLERRGKR